MCGALRGANNIIQERSARMSGRQCIECQACVAQHAKQQVIKIVRYTTSQDTNAFQLLRLPDLLFQTLPLQKLADLTCNYVQHPQKLAIRFVDFRTEEFDHRKNLIAEENRKAKSSVQSRFDRKWHARKVAILSHV